MRTRITIILTLFIGFQLTAQESAEGECSILRNAFHLEGTFKGGVMRYSYRSPSYSGDHNAASLNIGVQMGSTWYLTHGSEYRTGFAMTWLRTEFGVDPDDFSSIDVEIDAFQIGWANIWKYNEERALELNIVGGASMYLSHFEPFLGFQIAPEVKLRTNRTTLGLGYVYFHGSIRNQSESTLMIDSHQLRFTVGLWN